MTNFTQKARNLYAASGIEEFKEDLRESLNGSTVIEQVMPAFLFFWSSWFAIFNVTSASANFRNAQILTNTTWALIFMVIAIMELVIVYRHKIKERIFGLSILTALWFGWSMILFSSNRTTIGVVTYLMIAIMCFLSARKIKRNEL